MTATPRNAPAPQRRAFAAAHIVVDPWSSDFDACTIDWGATLRFRHHLWSHGLGVAEAMDTAQRGAGLDWPQALELIRATASEAPSGSLLACGAGTDHLSATSTPTLQDVIAAYEMQCDEIERAGAQVILMASRALARVARGVNDYAEVYGAVLSQLRKPAILHWLGPMFDPALVGYWGSADISVAMQSCLDVIRANASKVDGIKISLLDAEREIAMRRALPSGVRMYTGDDFNFPRLIRGDAHGHSDALLGVFDPLAAIASQAFAALDRGNADGFSSMLEPTIPLARKLFESPTRYYKSGVVFLAYLSGHQDHFVMAGGQQGARSLRHLCDVYRLACAVELFADPGMAAHRFRGMLITHGLDLPS